MLNCWYQDFWFSDSEVYRHVYGVIRCDGCGSQTDTDDTVISRELDDGSILGSAADRISKKWNSRFPVNQGPQQNANTL